MLLSGNTTPGHLPRKARSWDGPVRAASSAGPRPRSGGGGGLLPLLLLLPAEYQQMGVAGVTVILTTACAALAVTGVSTPPSGLAWGNGCLG
jgi:hypothetical protein